MDGWDGCEAMGSRTSDKGRRLGAKVIGPPEELANSKLAAALKIDAAQLTN